MNALKVVLFASITALMAMPVLALECANSGTATAVPPDDTGDEFATACGRGAVADGQASIAMGYIASSVGSFSTALGFSAESSGGSSTALGLESISAGVLSTALGAFATSGGENSTAVGYGASSPGIGSTALGYGADSVGLATIAVGYMAASNGDYSIALGYGSESIGVNSIALGIESTSTGTPSVALGPGTNSGGNFSTALGNGANSGGGNSTALGNNANSGGGYSTALGNSANAVGGSSTALGNGANSVGNYSTALGNGAASDGLTAIALGYFAASDGDYSSALGYGSESAGASSAALGVETSSAGVHSTALGYRAFADQPDTVILGSVAGVNGASSYAKVGIGTTNPLEAVDVARSAAAARFQLTSFTDTTSEAPQFIQRRARGTAAAPAAVQNGDNLGLFSFRGYNGATMGGSRATITAQAAGTFTGASNPTRLIFSTTPVGSTTPQSVLVITPDGKVQVKGVNLTVPDYVFEDDYKLMPLDELKTFIDKNGHLPGIPSADEVNAGVHDLAGSDMAQLQKIEELTLYTLQLQDQVRRQQARIADLETLQDRVAQLEMSAQNRALADRD